MKKYVQTPTNLYCTFCKSLKHNDRDFRDYDLMHERSRGHITRTKEKHNKKETLHCITPLEEEIAILTVDTEDEDKEEEWVEAKGRSSITNVHN
jgi:hypothetical protein